LRKPNGGGLKLQSQAVVAAGVHVPHLNLGFLQGMRMPAQ
jgi:hypothetical protein